MLETFDVTELLSVLVCLICLIVVIIETEFGRSPYDRKLR